MFIPHPLLQYVIRKRLTAKDAFTTLFPVIQDTDLEVVCVPVIEFLMVARTWHSAHKETYPVLDKISLQCLTQTHC